MPRPGPDICVLHSRWWSAPRDVFLAREPTFGPFDQRQGVVLADKAPSTPHRAVSPSAATAAYVSRAGCKFPRGSVALS